MSSFKIETEQRKLYLYLLRQTFIFSVTVGKYCVYRVYCVDPAPQIWI